MTTIGGALVLYAAHPCSPSKAGFAPISRESFLLMNNVLLWCDGGDSARHAVSDLPRRVRLRGVSVGPPYFSTMFLVPMLPLVFLLAPGMHAAWKRASFERTKVLLALLLAAIVLGIGIPAFAYGWRSVLSAVGIVGALWVALASLSSRSSDCAKAIRFGGRARHERRALRPGDVHSRRHDGRVL